MKKSTLLACTILGVFAFGDASAYDPHSQRGMLPTIEINLDALHNINNNQIDSQFKSQDLMPFAQQSQKDKKRVVKHKKHKKNKKKAANKVASKVEKAATAPEVKVIANKDKQVDDTPILVQVPVREKASLPQPSPAVKENKAPIEQGLALPAEKSPDLNVLPPLTKNDKKAEPVQLVPLPVGNAKDTNASPSPTAISIGDLPAPVPSPALPLVPDKKSSPDIKELEPVKKSELPSAPAAPDINVPPLPPMPGVQDNAGKPPVVPAIAESPKPALPLVTGVANIPDNGVVKKQQDSSPAPDARVVFNENETDIPSGSAAKLDVVAQQLLSHPEMRVSIMAYATGSDVISIYPKRVSLARGISVRNYLVTTKNIDLERVTVKALGNKSEAGPGNRVDVFIIK